MLATSTTALANPLSSKLKAQQQELQQNRNTYNNLEGQIEQTNASIQKLDNQIQNIMDDISSTNDKIAVTQQDIKNTESEIQKSIAEINSEQELFDKRVKAMYISGAEGYMSVLLSSKDFEDFISRAVNIEKIINYDNNIIKDLKIKNQEINKKKTSLGEQNKKLLALQEDNKRKLSNINTARDEQVRLIAQLKSQRETYASKVAEEQALVNATLQQIKAMKESAKKSSGSGNASRGGTGSVSAKGEAIVDYATDYLGVPYVWGGNTPAGFDCSGFTKYVFAHFGISLNRRASEQLQQGVPVSTSNLQPGDLVFFGDPVYHVGIYVGNGCFIHAPETGDVVKISALKWMDLTYARRLVR